MSHGHSTSSQSGARSMPMSQPASAVRRGPTSAPQSAESELSAMLAKRRAVTD
jgi:hypothetical protein